MKRSELENQLRDWSEANREELGFVQEWRVTVDAHDSYVGVEIAEADEGHILCGANGKTLEDACQEAANRVPQALSHWSWPSEFPIL